MRNVSLPSKPNTTFLRTSVDSHPIAEKKMLISKQKEVEKRDDGTKIIRRQVGAFSIEELRKDPKTWLQILSPRGAYSKIQEEVDALRRSGPYSLRLTKDGLSIAPTRTLIVISGQFLKGLLPSLSLKFSGDLIQAVSRDLSPSMLCSLTHPCLCLCSVSLSLSFDLSIGLRCS